MDRQTDNQLDYVPDCHFTLANTIAKCLGLHYITLLCCVDWVLKLTSLFIKQPQNTQMTTLYTNLSLYLTFTMIYYIRQE